MLVSDKVSGLFLVALGGASAYGGSLLPPTPGQQIGPEVFPMVVGVGLVLCGGMIALGVGSALEKEAEADLAAHLEKTDTPAAAPQPAASASVFAAKTLLPPALLLAYVFLVDRIGFVPMAFLIVLSVSLTMGARLKLALPLAIAASIAVQLIFVKILRVPLPPGLLPMPW